MKPTKTVYPDGRLSKNDKTVKINVSYQKGGVSLDLDGKEGAIFTPDYARDLASAISECATLAEGGATFSAADPKKAGVDGNRVGGLSIVGMESLVSLEFITPTKQITISDIAAVMIANQLITAAAQGKDKEKIDQLLAEVEAQEQGGIDTTGMH